MVVSFCVLLISLCVVKVHFESYVYTDSYYIVCEPQQNYIFPIPLFRYIFQSQGDQLGWNSICFCILLYFDVKSRLFIDVSDGDGTSRIYSSKSQEGPGLSAIKGLEIVNDFQV